MTRQEFNKQLDKLQPNDYIVFIKLKYKHENTYRYTQEYLYYDFEDSMWTWNMDWWEGEENVDIYGMISFEDMKEYYTVGTVQFPRRYHIDRVI